MFQTLEGSTLNRFTNAPAEIVPQTNNKKAFVFSTSGQTRGASKKHEQLKTTLQSKGFDIVGEFNCAGLDTFGPFRLAGGINKSRPNEEDLKQAEAFAKDLKEKLASGK